MTQTEMDKNLLVVTAVQGYAENHGIEETEAYKKFLERGIPSLIRREYDALHMQPLEETIGFAEDVMSRSTSL